MSKEELPVAGWPTHSPYSCGYVKPALREHIMQPCLNLMTLLKASLEEGIAAAAGAGFELVELWVDSLDRYLKDHTVDDLCRLLSKYRMRVLSIGDIESITFCTREQFAELAAQCERLAAIGGRVGCSTLVVSGSVKPRKADPAAVSDEIRSALARLLDVVEPEGVGLALAFRGFSWCSVNSLDQAIAAVEHHRDRKAGLALDTFDLCATGISPAALHTVDTARLSVVRLSDCGNVPAPLLSDTGRVLPGEGKAELGPMLDALAGAGYSGPVSLKILSPRLLDIAAEKIAETAMAAAAPYLEAARARTG